MHNPNRGVVCLPIKYVNNVPEEHVVVVAEDVGEGGHVLHGLVGDDRRVGGDNALRDLQNRQAALDAPDQEDDQRRHEQFDQLQRG